MKHEKHKKEDIKREHQVNEVEFFNVDKLNNEKSNIVNSENEIKEVVGGRDSKKNNILSLSIVFASIIIAGSLIYSTGQKNNDNVFSSQEQTSVSELEAKVLPSRGVVLNAKWGDLGVKLVEKGVIDDVKFKSLYEQRGQFSDEYRKLLEGTRNGKIKITRENSGYLLNLFWALGLSNKNDILDKGEMMNEAYGGPGNFASTGGWTISKGNAMDHYSMHTFMNLTPAQQAMVDKVSRGIYRPCCGNSVNFPDCNHGMAMLGLLELMASQGASEQDLWNTALVVNSYWFPDTYITIAKYMENKGIDWKNVNAQEVLGASYSSARGFANITAQVIQPQEKSQSQGAGCGIGAGAPAPIQKQTGCGI